MSIDAVVDMNSVRLPTIHLVYSPTREEWEEIAETIWVGALEGGSNHWIDDIIIKSSNVSLKKGFHVVEWNFHVAIVHGSDGWGDALEEDESVEYVRAFDVIVEGIAALDDRRRGLVFTDIGQLDANDYDLIIQLGVFGEEVYS